MKHLVACLSLIGALLFSSQAFAQNAEQIESVKEGKTTCSNCNLFQADFQGLNLSDRTFNGARLRQSDLSISLLDRANFNGANLSVANLFGARLQNTNLKNANLKDATLVGAWLGGADLTGADLQGAVLSGAYLKTAKGLTTEQLSGAICDASTELPSGLSLDSCQ